MIPAHHAEWIEALFTELFPQSTELEEVILMAKGMGMKPEKKKKPKSK